MLSPGSLFGVPVCRHPCVALAAACLPTVNGHVAASPAGLTGRGLLGRHRGSPQGQGGSWGAVVSGVGSLARGWPSLSPRKPSDKPATWSLLPKMWGMTAGWQLADPSGRGESGSQEASLCGERGDLLSHSWHAHFSAWWRMLLSFHLLA